MVGFNRRFAPLILELKDLLKNLILQNHLYTLVTPDILIAKVGYKIQKWEAED